MKLLIAILAIITPLLSSYSLYRIEQLEAAMKPRIHLLAAR